MTTAALNVSELARPARVDSVDLLRGIVMVIMALDHVRDYMTHLTVPPEILETTYGALFFTRWITHFCAPTFFFLAGTGIYFASRRKTGPELTSFLWKRGLFLILLEVTIIFWGWTFLFPLPGFGLLVIWCLGLSMIVMSGLVRLPLKWVAAIGLVMIFGHNLLDPINAENLGKLGPVWGVLHQSGFYPLFPLHIQGAPPVFGIFVLYPLIPWVGVMAAGYAFGSLYNLSADVRRRWMIRIGTGAILLFIVLRFTNVYGNAAPGASFFAAGPFVVQPTVVKTVIAFFNVAKYPPSLQFLLMTLGPSILALAWFDRFREGGGRFGRFLTVYGKVPMFYYILHIYLAHTIAIIAGLLFGQPVKWLLRGGFMLGQHQPGYGFNLPAIYVAWVICILLLYLPCKWYAEYKATHRQWWLSYL
jgi:uncharacterized membrane protein